MTTYLYRCSAGHEHDLNYPMGQAPASAGVCPTVVTGAFVASVPTEEFCGKPLNRVFTVGNVIMGPGFRPKWQDTVQRGSEEAKRFR